MNIWPRRWWGRLVVGVWSAPGGVLSLLAVLVLWPWARWRFLKLDDGALELHAMGPLGRALDVRGWAAFTFCWTIWYWNPPPVQTRRHELRHVRQALVLGVLMLPAYLLGLLAQGYEDNWFEVDARAHDT